MQDRYAGDIGDYVKLALLRALRGDRQLSVAWFRTPDAGPAGDGRYITYLEAPEKWAGLDPPLFDQLRALVSSGGRSIGALEAILAGPPILLFKQKGPTIPGPPATFHRELLTDELDRSVWFVGLNQFAFQSDFLFLDPDNGITSSPRPSIKHVSLGEVRFLRHSARTIVIYHHLSRAGDHLSQMAALAKRLVDPWSHAAVCAVRARQWSARAFFIVAPNREVWERAEVFTQQWPGMDFHAFTDKPDDLGLTPGADAMFRNDAREIDAAYRARRPLRL